MIITLDKLSTRYHLLPSEVLERADTFDLFCMDIGIRYEHVAEQKRKGTWQKPEKKLSESEMQKMLNQVKGAK